MKVGILNAYHHDPTPGIYQEQYMPMFVEILKEHVPSFAATSYRVAQGQFPETLEEQELWIVTGSPLSAYENIEWIQKLKDLIKFADSQKVKMVGLCFGHQIIAEALGGKVEKSPNGWGVGVRKFEVLRAKPWMEPDLKNCSLLYSHQDQVTKLPPDAEHLAKSLFCSYEMFAIGNHVFCMQGHPEFTKEYALKRLESRKQKVGQKTYEAALESFKQVTDASVVWKWVKMFASN